MKRIIYTFLFISMMLISLPSTSNAQKAPELVVPCAVPFYRELDFIVGEWQVFDYSTGKLVGYDRIGRVLRGCAIQQSFISLDDFFSSEYVPFRMNGRSTTAFDGQKWVHLWVDNQAGVQLLTGGPDKDKFLLSNDNGLGGYEYQLIWQRQDDGSVLNQHQRRKVGSVDGEEWEILYKWRYVKNLNENMVPENEKQD